MLRLISWNIHGSDDAWRMLASSGIDIALLQEAKAPPSDIASCVDVEDEPWSTSPASANRKWRTTIACFSSRVRLTRIPTAHLVDASLGLLPVSLPGTLSAAEVTAEGNDETVTLVSMYGAWERPLAATKSQWIYADASAQRLVSDISALIGRQRGHKIIAAGDLNILHGYGEDGSLYWQGRYSSVFERLEAMELLFLGPNASAGGAQASPWPSELPPDSTNVPTFRRKLEDPASATRQLDFVFASYALLGRITVCALNNPTDWGPSDHCRVRIDLDDEPRG
jgi:exonuclease III